MRSVRLPSGEFIPALGQGTWHLGEKRRDEAIEALRVGLDLGMTLIDTAEMHVGAEDLVREAIAGRRHEVFLVDKIEPRHATRYGTAEACENSLRRLGTDRIDLYLLHWHGGEHLEEVVTAFEELVEDGKIRYWGVSNFDVAQLEELYENEDAAPQTNQVLYNLIDRAIEWDVLRWARAHGLPIMAYSPIAEGLALQHPAVRRVAARHHATCAQIALAWVLRGHDIVAIPRAGHAAHVRENRRALEIVLSAQDLRDLDRVCDAPAPPLYVI